MLADMIPPPPKDIKAEEEAFWKDAFLASLVGCAPQLSSVTANMSASAYKVTLKASHIADEALVQLRNFQNKRDLEDDPPEESSLTP